MARPLRHSHDVQSNQYSQVAGAVQKEVSGVTKGGHAKSGQGRPQCRGPIEYHRLQTDGIPKIFLGDQNRNQRPSSRLIETQQDSIQECQHQNHPELNDPEQGEEAQQDSQYCRASLRA